MNMLELTPDIGVQIINYKSVQYLTTCLEALIEDLRNGPTHTITVLDNDSGDDLSAIEKKFGTRVKVYKNPKNIGFGPAHNQLAKDQTARTLLLLNPDTACIEPNTMRRLYDRFEEKENTAVVGPRLIDPRRRKQDWDHGDFLFETQVLGKRIRPYVFPIAPSFDDARVRSVPWVSGAVFLIDRIAFRAQGGFDPNLFLYFEEVELCNRLLKSGSEIIYDPTISVEHIGSVSTAPTKYENFIRSFGYVTTNEYPPAIAWMLQTLYSKLPRSLFE